jgi:N-acetylglucosaminyldiphosphoundecaprenol N-acetyl-beta-D-mannosaminyltransferase
MLTSPNHSSTSPDAIERVMLLNVPIDNMSMSEFLPKLKQGGVVVTPNVDHVVKLQKDAEFCDVYRAATYRTCDSQTLVYVSRFLGTPIKERISGSDLFPAFYTHYQDDAEVTIFLLGAAEGVAATAQEKINAKVGRQMVVAAHSPSFGFEKREDECQQIIQRVNESGATVLAVGVGAPKQEKWIYKYKDQMPNVKLFLAIGATIDFEAGKTSRAPAWISNLGIEWVYRLLSEPKRLWKRYLVDDLVPFGWLVLQQRLNLYKPTQVIELD